MLGQNYRMILSCPLTWTSSVLWHHIVTPMCVCVVHCIERQFITTLGFPPHISVNWTLALYWGVWLFICTSTWIHTILYFPHLDPNNGNWVVLRNVGLLTQLFERVPLDGFSNGAKPLDFNTRKFLGLYTTIGFVSGPHPGRSHQCLDRLHCIKWTHMNTFLCVFRLTVNLNQTAKHNSGVLSV